jgi:hypothetical protein
MTFFASSRTAQGKDTFLAPHGHRSLGSAFVTFNTEKARQRGTRDIVSSVIESERAAFGDHFNVKENAGGRQPPRRNTSRCT